jgi:hypothetical protein
MSSMPDTERAAARHWLLPHERWFARIGDRVRARHEAEPPGPQRQRFLRNYGPDGQVFVEAALVNLLAGVILALGGLVLSGLAADHGIAATTGNWLTGIGILAAVISFVRAIQGSHAGRVFRAGRPFIRAGQPMR